MLKPARPGRQTLCRPILDDSKTWIEKTSRRVPKDSLTWIAINYTLSQWELVGCCEDGTLNDWQRRLLDDIGFCWDPEEVRWQVRYHHQLADFHRQHGHCRVPHRSVEPPRVLANWIIHQRRLCARGAMPDAPDVFNASGEAAGY